MFKNLRILKSYNYQFAGKMNRVLQKNVSNQIQKKDGNQKKGQTFLMLSSSSKDSVVTIFLKKVQMNL